MKAMFTAALVAVVTAQPKPDQNLFIEFTSCQSQACGSSAQECCQFDDNRSQKVKFCMTDKQKNGQWTGLYKDNDQTEWEWTCKVPPPKGSGGVGSTEGKYSTKGNTWMEILLWITYISGVFWVFGYLVQIPLGSFIMIWL